MRERYARFPGAGEALLLVMVLFAAEYVVGAALRDLRGFSGIDPRDIDGVVTVLGNGVLFSVLLYYKRMTYGSLFHPSANSVGATVATVGVPILLMVPALVLALSSCVAILESLFPVPRWQQAMFERMMSNPLNTIVATCILAPLLEEMLFRGVILRAFLLQYRRRQAFLYSAAIFGLAHLNIYQFTIGFVIGLLLAWLYERTQSLWPCILLHAAYNSVITWFWFSRPESDAVLWDVPAPALLLYLALGIAGLYLLHRILGAVQNTSGSQRFTRRL